MAGTVDLLLDSNQDNNQIIWALESCPGSNLNSPYTITTAQISGEGVKFDLNTNIIVNSLAVNQPPQIIYIESIPDQAPIENSITTIIFETQITDTEGFTDITSVNAEFSGANEITKTNPCIYQSDDGINTATYSCSIDMQYYDGAGIWDIKIQATDSTNPLVENTSTTFIYLPLEAMIISQPALTWPITTQGAVNQIPGTSTIITNTGNVEGSITIQATNLYGTEQTTEFIPANTFSVGIASQAEKQCKPPTTATTLQDGTPQTIIDSILNKGPGQQEELFYCIPLIPSVSSQTYNTQQAGSWTISLLLVAITIKPKKKNKKKSKRKSKQKTQKQIPQNDNLIISLNLISKELQQEYSKEKQQIIRLLINQIKKKYKLNNNEIKELTIIKQQIKIPINIFSKKLGALEAITKYMKENLNMRYKEISKLLNRNERTIWTAYNKSKQKQPNAIKIKQSKIQLSISIFQNKKLTMLEALAIYLKNQNLNYKEIGELLDRDQRNIWTIHSNALKK